VVGVLTFIMGLATTIYGCLFLAGKINGNIKTCILLLGVCFALVIACYALFLFNNHNKNKDKKN
jgi:hypothetical protein